MILAIDVGYSENKALAIGVLFEDWNSTEPMKIYKKQIENIEPYEAGAFYKRELPCILSLLDNICENVTAIVVDGYVHLGKERKAGLGAHLFNALDAKIPVVGVAKNYFKETPKEHEVFRGKSQKPIYVTAVGLPLEDVITDIKQMAGKNRIPTLLKLADRYSREW